MLTPWKETKFIIFDYFIPAWVKKKWNKSIADVSNNLAEWLLLTDKEAYFT